MKKKMKLNLEAQGPLSHNPFRDLGPLPLTKSPARAAAQPIEVKQGSLLIREEKRGKGKWVTCVYHVQTDRIGLLKQLKRSLGTGGCLTSTDDLEIQGRQADKIIVFFLQKGFKVLGH